jgi:hypothetical protein
MYTIEYVSTINGKKIREYGFAKRLFKRMLFLMNSRNEFTLEKRYSMTRLRKIPFTFKSALYCLLGTTTVVRKEY